MDQLDRQAEQTSSFYLKPWPVLIFEDFPFSWYIVAASESEEALVFTQNGFGPKQFLIQERFLEEHLGSSLIFHFSLIILWDPGSRLPPEFTTLPCHGLEINSAIVKSNMRETFVCSELYRIGIFQTYCKSIRNMIEI